MESAKGKGVTASTSEEQIVPAPASMEGVNPTGTDKSVGKSAPPPSTTTSEEQIVQADPMGDQPSTKKQNGGGETVGEFILSKQGGSKEVIQNSTGEQKVGGESVGYIVILTKQGGE